MSEQLVLDSMLPVWVVLVPLITTFLLILFAGNAAIRHFLAVAGCLGTLAAVAMMYPEVSAGNILYFELPTLFTPLNFTMAVDGFGFLVALISSFVWLAATIYSVSYMDHEKNPERFFIFLFLTFTGTIGVPLAGDLLTLLVFFEVMTLASYVLVIHTQTKDAMSAGNIYLYMGIFGGISILVGIGLIYNISGVVIIGPGMEALSTLTNAHLLAVVMLVIGFGIKAGMVPLHIWLPRAHPVAPAPASALLSGIMIKAGAYGIIRTVNMLFTPRAEGLQAADVAAQFSALWENIGAMGYVMIWFGIVTMFFGAAMAVLQENIKKMLACSSISQMGYIIMGVGCAAYLGLDGAMGLAGSSFHILNHALFKSALFLVAGVFAYRLGELNMYNLGGLAKKMPFTTVIALVAAFGIVGIPFFNGYSSKTLLHHAIEKAYHVNDLFSLQVAEWIFTLTSALTVCYFIKFMYHTFFRKTDRDYKDLKSEPALMKVGMSILGLTMLAVGFFPNRILDGFILPALNRFIFDSANIDKYLAGINFFPFSDILAIIIALALGALIFWGGMRTGIFKTTLPEWLSQEYVASYIGRVLVVGFAYVTLFFTAIGNFFSVLSGSGSKKTFTFLQNIDYKPGKSAVFRTINFGSIDFDIFLVMFILGLVLIYLFFSQFGLGAILG